MRGFCEYSGQNILVANKDTFLDKQGSYLLMDIIVLGYHQLERQLCEEHQDLYVIVYGKCSMRHLCVTIRQEP